METSKPNFFYKENPQNGQKEYLNKFAARVNLEPQLNNIVITDIPITREK